MEEVVLFVEPTVTFAADTIGKPEEVENFTGFPERPGDDGKSDY